MKHVSILLLFLSIILTSRVYGIIETPHSKTKIYTPLVEKIISITDNPSDFYPGSNLRPCPNHPPPPVPIIAKKKSCIDLVGPFLKDVPSEPKDPSLNALDYLEKYKKLNHSISQEKIQSILRLYTELEKRMKTAPLISYEGDIWRGIRKDILKIGIEKNKTERGPPKHKRSIVFDTSEDFFKQFNRKTTHRYSMPGEVALYTSIGFDKNDAIKTIQAELKSLDANNFHVENLNVKMEKILNLTDPRIQGHLKIHLTDITQKDKSTNSYEITHIIGHIAKHIGIHAIIAESAERAEGVNLAIFIENIKTLNL